MQFKLIIARQTCAIFVFRETICFLTFSVDKRILYAYNLLNKLNFSLLKGRGITIKKIKYI